MVLSFVPGSTVIEVSVLVVVVEVSPCTAESTVIVSPLIALTVSPIFFEALLLQAYSEVEMANANATAFKEFFMRDGLVGLIHLNSKGNPIV